jgi:hypothetical protein
MEASVTDWLPLRAIRNLENLANLLSGPKDA